MEPSIHGHELSPGDQLGNDTTPECCHRDMTTNGTVFGCATCGTALEVNDRGLISNIT